MTENNLQPLCDALTLKGIPFELKSADERVESLIGSSLTGKYHMIIQNKYSVIKGAVSFGKYEIMNLKNGKFQTPERFETPEELINEL